MEKVELTKADQTRTTEGLQLRFRLAWQRLALSRKARIFGEKPTKEYVNAALWHFFSEMGEGEAEAFLAEWFPKLEVALRREVEDRDEGSDGGESGPEVKLPEGGIAHRDLPKGPKKKRAR